MVNLSLIELKIIAKIRGIKGYESMPEDKLLNALNASESVKTIRSIKGYESMYEDKPLSALNASELVKTIREIREENSDGDKILRDFDLIFDPEKRS